MREKRDDFWWGLGIFFPDQPKIDISNLENKQHENMLASKVTKLPPTCLMCLTYPPGTFTTYISLLLFSFFAPLQSSTISLTRVFFFYFFFYPSCCHSVFFIVALALKENDSIKILFLFKTLSGYNVRNHSDILILL